MQDLFGSHTPLPALVVLGGLVAVLSLVGASEPLARRGYASRMSVGIALVVALNLVNNADVWEGWKGGHYYDFATRLITYLASFALIVAVFRWVGRRLVDLGIARWWGLLCLVPVINAIVVIALLFPASRDARSQR